MLTITLTFKSIDAARAALLEIPSSSLVGGDAVEAGTSRRVTDKAEPVAAPVKAEKAKPAPVAEVKVEAPKPVAVEPIAPAPVAAPAASSSVDYPTLQKAVFALAGKSRDAAAAVAASFSVKTFKELPEAKWADALAAVNVALAA